MGPRDLLGAFSSGGVYVNFPGLTERDDDVLTRAYGENYARLVELKRRFDPENRFQPGRNLTIAVDAATGAGAGDG